MIESFENLTELLKSNKIKLANIKLNDIINKYSFFHIFQHLDTDQKYIMSKNIKESEVIMINQFELKPEKEENMYFIIGYKNTIIIIKQILITLLLDTFINNTNLSICFLSSSKNMFNKYCQIKYNEIDMNQQFDDEITFFNEKIKLKNVPNNQIKQIWESICPIISGYLIKQSYSKLNINRFINFDHNDNINSQLEIFDVDSYIQLRNLGMGSNFQVFLIYQIEKGKLLALKKPIRDDELTLRLVKREIENYKNICHPLLPKLYGTVKNKSYIIIEFINGRTLLKCKDISSDEKISIICDLLLIVNYFHEKKFILRDLKPDNIIISKDKTAVMIDFDQALNPSIIQSDREYTNDFSSKYVAPEVNYGQISYKNDIYSLGMIIKFIINELGRSKSIENYSKLEKICNTCTNSNPEKRPNIFNLFNNFLLIYRSKLDFSKYQNEPIVQHCLGLLYYEGPDTDKDIYKSIQYFSNAAKQNYPKSLLYLGHIYYNGKYVKQNINKSIQYFQLASDLGYSLAQYNYGIIYYEGVYVMKDINKAIYYFSLAANQNLSDAQFALGKIYCEDEIDIDKSIHYLSLASDQNNLDAIYYLGLIYSDGVYVKIDIHKAIHYFTLAANQNHSKSQFELGLIYYKGNLININIEKSIHYFKLAADQNNINAQFNLGIIYYEGRLIPQDINKAIHYFTLAANQNHKIALRNIAGIYYDGKYVNRDINKAIYYYSIDAHKNNSYYSQYILGLIFYEGKYCNVDIKKAIYYFTLSANQNYANSQYNLGVIYYDGIDIDRDINKAIYYFSKAASQNQLNAQYKLGVIYYYGNYVPRDINKAMHYFQILANKNYSKAQFLIGLIYYEGIYIKRDMEKAIKYFSLAANQNHPFAEYALGLIYYNGEFVDRDINKSIHYLSLAANNNIEEALYNIGCIYFEGKYVEPDIDKSIKYFLLASNKNNSNAQYLLGICYLYEQFNHFDIKKGIYYLNLSAKNGFKHASFAVGCLYYEGKYVKRDIQKAIIHYKEASSFNIQFAKNNLGIIYKNGFGNEIPQNIELAKEYLNEAIRQKNDYLSMYNLARIYLFYEQSNKNFEKSIELLMLSSEKGFTFSKMLLCLVLFKNFGYDMSKMRQEITKFTKYPNEFLSFARSSINEEKLYIDSVYEKWFQYFKNYDFLYNMSGFFYQSDNTKYQEITQEYADNRNNITSDFYEGFGF